MVSHPGQVLQERQANQASTIQVSTPIPPDDSPLPAASSTSNNQLPVVTTTGSSSGASMLSPAQLQQIAGAVADILRPSSMANPLAATAPSPITVPAVTGSSEGIYP